MTLLISLSGLSPLAAAGDIFLSQALSPTHLDPQTVADPFRSRFLRIDNGGDGEDGGGFQPARERWLEGLISNALKPAETLIRVQELLPAWPSREAYEGLRSLGPQESMPALAQLLVNDASPLGCRFNAVSAMVAIEGMESAAAFIPWIVEIDLLQKIGEPRSDEDLLLSSWGFPLLTDAVLAASRGESYPEALSLLAGAFMARYGIILHQLPRGTPESENGLSMAALVSLGGHLLSGLKSLRRQGGYGAEAELVRLCFADFHRLIQRHQPPLAPRTNLPRDPAFFGEAWRRMMERNRRVRTDLLPVLERWPDNQGLKQLQVGEAAGVLGGIARDLQQPKLLRDRAVSALFFLREELSMEDLLMGSLILNSIQGLDEVPVGDRRFLQEALLGEFGFGLSHFSEVLRKALEKGDHALLARVLQVMGGAKMVADGFEILRERNSARLDIARLQAYGECLFKGIKIFQEEYNLCGDRERETLEPLWIAIQRQVGG